ncbi:hypothetical protein H257_19407, partial [Aphanomyces astaci]
MTGNPFNTYLLALNERMVAEERKVLLLVDNAPPHKPDDESLYVHERQGQDASKEYDVPPAAPRCWNHRFVQGQ